MTKHEENVFSMYNAVDALLKSNTSKTESVPALKLSAENFSVKLSEIQDKDSEFKDVTAGKTITKRNGEDEMIDAILPVSAAVSVYAKINNMEDLKAIFNVTISELRRMRDQDLLEKAKSIYAKADGLKSELTTYGVTEEMITELNNKIGLYNSSIAKKDTSFAERSAARKALSMLFDAANDILKEELDNLIELFRESDRDFYNQFKSARVIKDLGMRKAKQPEEIDD